jgi:peptidoglycan/LPS O-acetylase OafA/YrhL
VTAATVAIAVLAVVWFFLGSASLSAAIGRGTFSPAALAILGVLTMANLGLLILAAVANRSSRRALRAFVVVVLGLNAVVSITDQVGPADVLYLLLTVAALLMVVLAWRHRPRESRLSS